MKMFKTVLNITIFGILGLIIGGLLFLSALADMVELTIPAGAAPFMSESEVFEPKGQLKVVDYYGEQTQLFEEDDTTPQDKLSATETPQVTRHSHFIQVSNNTVQIADEL